MSEEIEFKSSTSSEKRVKEESVPEKHEEEQPETKPEPKPETKPEKVKKSSNPKKPTRKDQLIIDVLTLYSDQYSEAQLRGMTMAKLSELKKNFKVRADTQRLFPGAPVSSMPETEEECKELMGKAINEHLGDYASDKPIDLTSAANKLKTQKLSPEVQFELRATQKAKNLFNFHLVGGGILECLSEAEPIEQRLGTNLSGLSKDFLDDKETFLEVLKDLYVDYAEEIDPWISSITVYSLFMSSKIQARFMENKKKSSRGELGKSPLKLETLLGLQPSQPVSSPVSVSLSAQPPSYFSGEKREDNIPV